MAKKIFTLFFVALCGYASAKMDMCRSKPPVMKDFELLKLEGRWYEFAHLPNIFQYFTTERCNSIDMYQVGSSVRFNMSFINETSEMRVHLEGNMTTSTDNPGKVLVNIFDMGFQDNFTVVDAQYDNYVIFYFCDTLLYFKIELAWVLTREPILSEEHRFSLLDKLKILNIDIDKLQYENQKDCELRWNYHQDNFVK